uniref:Uncharacterized protein n=1 Tax=Paracidobacterium acidisoli TaxID=2303751 RepID=A0A372ILD2_9BACT
MQQEQNIAGFLRRPVPAALLFRLAAKMEQRNVRQVKYDCVTVHPGRDKRRQREGAMKARSQIGELFLFATL